MRARRRSATARVHRLAVVGVIGGQRADVAGDLIEQAADLGRVGLTRWAGRRREAVMAQQRGFSVWARAPGVVGGGDPLQRMAAVVDFEVFACACDGNRA